MKYVFEIKNHHYDFRRDMHLQRGNVNTVLYGTEIIASLGAQIWNLVPRNLRCSKSVNVFKKNIRTWTTKNILADYAKTMCMYKTVKLFVYIYKSKYALKFYTLKICHFSLNNNFEGEHSNI